MADYFNLRISAALGERIKTHAKLLDRTPNKFAEMAIDAICSMIERQEARVVPEMVATADLVRKHTRHAEPLKSKVATYPQGEENLKVAEQPPHPQAAPARRAVK